MMSSSLVTSEGRDRPQNNPAGQRDPSLRWKVRSLSDLLDVGNRDYGLVIAVIEITRGAAGQAA
jgi:hypothetical protein